MEDYIKNVLEEIKSSDKEAKSKLKLLGLTEEQVTKMKQHLIDQEHEPEFTKLAMNVKSGMYQL